MKYIGGTKLDERIIRSDLDEGFIEGRQYGYVFFSYTALSHIYFVESVQVGVFRN
jgi:hypothetical protein